jgi:hypothetical protein
MPRCIVYSTGQGIAIPAGGGKEQADIQAVVRSRLPGFAVLRPSHSQEVSYYGREDLTRYW